MPWNGRGEVEREGGREGWGPFGRVHREREIWRDDEWGIL